MFVVPLSVNYGENITEYQFSLIFADILNYDLSNELGAVSDMSLEAKRFMSYIKRGINTFPALYDNLDIILPTGAIPFMERFGDHTAGVALDCVIQVFEDLNACDFYPSPTPTAQPTNTPSMTPSNTPTPEVTPTMTMTPSPTAQPAVTPTMTMTPSPSATCGLTTQYLKEQLQGNNSIKLSLFVDAGFTIPANATCDLGVTGTYDILGGASGVPFNTSISNGDHTHVFNTGNHITGFTVTNINTVGCTCPVNIILP
jgi:hypothetical protein